MLQALTLAEEAIGLSEPNPRVGCVIGFDDGTILGQGYTQELGGPHAEVMAIRQARAAGLSTHGATAWVTLEPCAHHGRTPPCCDALLASGIARVVVALQDPFPQVAGKGLERLRAQGVQVDLADSDLQAAAVELNIGFLSRHQRGRPWVRLKTAASLDGRTALADGRSQWITGEAARADGQQWRRRAGAVLTGIGTVLADDPRLDVRLPTRVQPLRVVVDSALRLPPHARILAHPGRTCIATLQADSPQACSLRDAGAEVLACPADPTGRVDLGWLLQELQRRTVNELHVEAGAALCGSLLAQGLVDEWLLYQAPVLLGPGRAVADLAPLTELGLARRWQLQRVHRLGDDLCLRLRPEAAQGVEIFDKHCSSTPISSASL